MSSWYWPPLSPCSSSLSLSLFLCLSISLSLCISHHVTVSLFLPSFFFLTLSRDIWNQWLWHLFFSRGSLNIHMPNMGLWDPKFYRQTWRTPAALCLMTDGEAPLGSRLSLQGGCSRRRVIVKLSRCRRADLAPQQSGLTTGNLLGIGGVVVVFVGGQTIDNVPGCVCLSTLTAGFGFGPVVLPSLLFWGPDNDYYYQDEARRLWQSKWGLCVFISHKPEPHDALNKHLFGPWFVEEAALMLD